MCLDYVSRPDAFARLYPRLLAGYLVEAVDRDQACATGPAADRLLAALDAAEVTHRPSVGLGEDVRLSRAGVTGSGLVADGELVQLCAFPLDPATARFAPSASPHRAAVVGEFTLVAVSPRGENTVDEDVASVPRTSSPEDAMHMALVLVARGAFTIRIDAEGGFVMGHLSGSAYVDFSGCPDTFREDAAH